MFKYWKKCSCVYIPWPWPAQWFNSTKYVEINQVILQNAVLFRFRGHSLDHWASQWHRRPAQWLSDRDILSLFCKQPVIVFRALFPLSDVRPRITLPLSTTENTRHSTNVVLVIAQGLQSWSDIKATLAQPLVETLNQCCFNVGPASWTLGQH